MHFIFPKTPPDRPVRTFTFFIFYYIMYTREFQPLTAFFRAGSNFYQDGLEMLQKLTENWQRIKDFILDEYDLSNISYNAWILPLKIHHLSGETLTVSYGSETSSDTKFVVDYLTRKYALPMSVAIEEITGIHVNVVFIVEEKPDENRLFHRDETFSDQRLMPTSRASRLNPGFTFDEFVVGASNQFAHAAAVSVAENPGLEFNPLFIYGGSGLGKTHLMHAIANHILKNDPSKKIIFVTSEEFTNELIESISDRNKNNSSYFKNKYRSVDVFLIDDIQFIIGKEATQEEFFHTFNYLYENKKQIVISSDQPPKAFQTLSERLRSRFESGLTQEITAPDYETRMAILRKKEEKGGYTVDNQILQYIATNIRTNIRELEGALNKVHSFSKLDPEISAGNKELDLEKAKVILKDIINPDEEKKLTPDAIIKVVADHFGIRVEDIKSKKQTNEIVLPRQISMYFIRLLNDHTLEEVGRILGGRDHTTVSYSCEKIIKKMMDNEEFRQTIDVIRKKLER